MKDMKEKQNLKRKGNQKDTVIKEKETAENAFGKCKLYSLLFLNVGI